MHVYNSCSAVVHPDKCIHPPATEGFKKLCAAHRGWGLNRHEWHLEREAQVRARREQQAMQEWEQQGGRIRWWVLSEAWARLWTEEEEDRLYTQGTEVAEWLKLMIEGKEDWIRLSQRPSPQQRLYCVCRKPENRKEYWIQCGRCAEWFHPKCLGTTRAACEETLRSGQPWTCPTCSESDPMDLGQRGEEREAGTPMPL